MTDRVAPLPPGDWPAGMQDALAALRPANPRHEMPPRDPSRPKGLNVLGMLAHHPELTTGYHHLVGHLLFGTTLTVRQRELVILRVAAHREADYEWAQHVVIALGDAGMTDEEVERIRTDPTSAEWDPVEAAILAACDQLVDVARIDDPTYATLAEHLDVQQLMDLIFTVGAYDLLAMATLTFDLELDDDLRKRDSQI